MEYGSDQLTIWYKTAQNGADHVKHAPLATQIFNQEKVKIKNYSIIKTFQNSMFETLKDRALIISTNNYLGQTLIINVSTLDS